MRVADYRWITNAAALGAAGWLKDDGDIASRMSRVVHLDDEAIVFEGVQERRDLCGDNASGTHTLRRTMHRWNSAAPIKATVACSATWDSFLDRHPCYTAANCRNFFTESALTVVPLRGWAASIDDLVARLLGPKTPPTIPWKATWRPLLLSDAYQASNAMFETDTFFLFWGERTDADPQGQYNLAYKAWLHDPYGFSTSQAYDWYWEKQTEESDPVETTYYGTLEIDIYKTGGITSWADQCLFMGCLLEWNCVNRWLDVGRTDDGRDGRNDARAWTPLVLTKAANGHFTYSGQMTQAERARIVAACGNHEIDTYGYREIFAELVGVRFFAIFDPIAATARSLP